MNKGGFPGMGNMNQLMKQAKKMQDQLAKLQEELESKTVEATVGGGAVTVVANGKKEIVSIKISQQAVDPDDIEMLEDLVLAAANEALRNAEEMKEKEMSKITGGLGMPGMF